jgi:S-adenosylmethionine:tRNA ribosyltransferase-isomerase
MLVSEFDYALPPELIAQQPAPQRAASRLLRLDAASGAIEDLAFSDLPSLLGPSDAVVLNDTRVIKARLAGRKRSGGKIEVFIERAVSPREALALIRASHPPAVGSELLVGDGVVARVEGRAGELFKLRFAEDIEPVLERFGGVPLPPYIEHPPRPEDAERYQTVYAASPGAVAAPTAGLHFDAEILGTIEKRGTRIATITLHAQGTLRDTSGRHEARFRAEGSRGGNNGATRARDGCIDREAFG